MRPPKYVFLIGLFLIIQQVSATIVNKSSLNAPSPSLAFPQGFPIQMIRNLPINLPQNTYQKDLGLVISDLQQKHQNQEREINDLKTIIKTYASELGLVRS